MRISDWSSDVCSSDLSRPMCASAASAPAFSRASNSQIVPHAHAEGARPQDRIAAVRERFGMDVGHRPAVGDILHVEGRAQSRSEEHTSELQSLMRISYAVFCLKKKKIKHSQQQTTSTNENT